MPLGNSPQLQIPLMAENDNQKYLAFNDAVQALDDSLNRLLVLDFTTANITLLESQLTRYQCFRGTGNTVARTLTIPQTVGSSPAVTVNRFLIFDNRGNAAITLTQGGTTVIVPATTVTLVYCDGTDVTAVASASGFDMGVRTDGNVDFVNNPTFLNFLGNGVDAVLNGLGTDITVTLSEAQDDGVSQQTDTAFFNFTGSGVTVTPSGAGVTVNVPGASSGVQVQEEGTNIVAAATVLNYLGQNVTVTDVAGNANVSITAPTVQDESIQISGDPTFFNFLGAGVTATNNGTGIDITIPGAGSTGVDVRKDGTNVSVGTSVLDFIGANIAVTDIAGNATLTLKAPTVQDETTPISADPTFINFEGAGVTTTASGAGVVVSIPGASGTAIPVEDEGVLTLAAADRLNFIGTGVTVTANGNTADVTITGGGGGSAIETQKDGVQVVAATDVINFVGDGVNVTNPSADVTQIEVAQALNNLVVVAETYETIPFVLPFSTSAFATKGNVVDVTKDRLISSIIGNIDASQTVKLVIARVDAATPNAIQEIIYDGTPQVITTPGDIVFRPENVLLVDGQSYAIMFVRTDSTPTTSINLAFPGGTSNTDSNGTFVFSTPVRYASVDPQVADNTDSGVSGAVYMVIDTVDAAFQEGLIDFSRSTPVAFHATNTLGSAASGVQLFPNEDLDEGGDFDVTTGKFVAPIAGVYHFYGAAVIDGGGANGNVFIRVAGTQRARSNSFTTAGVQNDSHSVSLTIRLDAGQEVDLETSFAMASSTVAWNYFGGYLLNASTGNAPTNIVTETTTTLSSVQAHTNSYVVASNASPLTYTVNDDTLFNHDIGATITLEQGDVGQIAVVPNTGVTVRSAATNFSRTQYSVVVLTKIAPDTWTLTGDLAT